MIAYLNIGTNLGDKKQNIEEAVTRIQTALGTEVMRSSIIESEPWGFKSPNTFLNIGVAVDVDMSPFELLDVIHDIERSCGSITHRHADGSYADRIIDIDIMDIEGVVLNTPELTIPHQHLHDRIFFEVPYNELKTLVSLM